jgi:hypothetical protein
MRRRLLLVEDFLLDQVDGVLQLKELLQEVDPTVLKLRLIQFLDKPLILRILLLLIFPTVNHSMTR